MLQPVPPREWGDVPWQSRVANLPIAGAAHAPGRHLECVDTAWMPTSSMPTPVAPSDVRNVSERRGRRARYLARGVAPACVLGGSDAVRPLARAGIPCAVVTDPDDPVRRSRHVHWSLDARAPGDERIVDDLLAFAHTLPARPVLYPCTDEGLLIASRHREALGTRYDMVLADADLIERLVDKGRFDALASEVGLPVPRSTLIRTAEPADRAVALRFPLIVKPASRDPRWATVAKGKAVVVDSPDALCSLRERLRPDGIDLIAQELVPGPETAIESYHAYIDAAGHLRGEFAGRKIRTLPRAFGFSTAVEITDAPDVLAAGRTIMDALGLTGVAKCDLKRDPDGELHLLEVNPRFTLWNHPGARAGVNLPALVHADLTGTPTLGPPRPARPGVRWCDPTCDRTAAREHGMSTLRWMAFALGCEARTLASLDDPMPYLADIAWPRVRKRLQSRRRTKNEAGR